MQFFAVQRSEPPQTLLTHRGCSIVGGGRDMVTGIFANIGCQQVHCGISTFHSPQINADARAKIIDAPLTLILGAGYDLVVSIFAWQDGWQEDYRSLQQYCPWIFQDARSKIIDALLTLSFRAQSQCCLMHFCLERQPIFRLQVNVAAQPLYFPRCKAKSR